MESSVSKKIDLDSAPVTAGTRYPPPHDAPCRARFRTRLGDAAGLTQFGVNLLRLPPGAWSSQRHWHSAEDEFVYVVEGEVVLVTDAGEETLRAGDCAGFEAGAKRSFSRSARAIPRRTRWTIRTSTSRRRAGGRGSLTRMGRSIDEPSMNACDDRSMEASSEGAARDVRRSQ